MRGAVALGQGILSDVRRPSNGGDGGRSPSDKYTWFYRFNCPTGLEHKTLSTLIFEVASSIALLPPSLACQFATGRAGERAIPADRPRRRLPPPSAGGCGRSVRRLRHRDVGREIVSEPGPRLVKAAGRGCYRSSSCRSETRRFASSSPAKSAAAPVRGRSRTRRCRESAESPCPADSPTLGTVPSRCR